MGISYDGRLGEVSKNSCQDHVVRKEMLAEHHGKTNPKYYASGNVYYKKATDNATTPTKDSGDAGWDLYACGDRFIPPHRRATINTGICFEIPKDHVGLIWPRSGLAANNGIDVFAGVVDAGYRGEVKVCLYNSSERGLAIKKGDRIAQILFQEIPRLRLVESETLSDTNRGDGGFGSSGR